MSYIDLYKGVSISTWDQSVIKGNSAVVACRTYNFHGIHPEWFITETGRTEKQVKLGSNNSINSSSLSAEGNKKCF